MTSLFRSEVIQNQTPDIGVPLGLGRTWTGSYSLFLLVAISAGVLTVLFGTYPRKAHVMGFLTPDLGIIKIMSPRGGRVVQAQVAEGTIVSENDIIFVVDVSGISGAGPTNDLMAENLKSRRKLIQNELQRLDTVHDSDRRRLKAEVDGYRRQMAALEQNLAARLAFAALAQHALDRAVILEAKGTYSLVQRETAESQWAGANAQVADLRNSLAGVGAALA